MSPFGQLSTHLGYNGGIDRDFSRILNYVDELDRHFARRHHLINCFIPRFDLEEDSQLYYLYGEIPGSRVDDITIEPRDKNILVIYGTTRRNEVELGSQNKNNDILMRSPTQVASTGNNQEVELEPSALLDKPSRVPPHSHHHTPGGTTSYIEATSPSKANHRPTRKILLNERLVGDFHRTFALPTPIVEESIRATLEDGVLTVLIPKINGIERAKRIPIMHGN